VSIPAAPASRGRWKIVLAAALGVVAVALIAWRLAGTDAPPPVEPALESQAVKLKQELMLLEQQRPPDAEPEPGPDQVIEPTRAARPVK